MVFNFPFENGHQKLEVLEILYDWRDNNYYVKARNEFSIFHIKVVKSIHDSFDNFLEKWLWKHPVKQIWFDGSIRN